MRDDINTNKTELIQMAVSGDHFSDFPLEAMMNRLEDIEMANTRLANDEESEMVPTFCARALTVGGDRAEITFDGHTYTLRITRENKLILTK